MKHRVTPDASLTGTILRKHQSRLQSKQAGESFEAPADGKRSCQVHVIGYVAGMSLAELKRGAVALPETERRELAAYLLQIGRERSPAWRDEISRRMSEMDSGKKVTQAEFEQRAGLGKN